MSTTTPSLSEAKRLLLERRLRGEGIGPKAANASIERRPADAPLPISPEQRHVWMHAQLAPGLPLYNESVIFHRHGTLDLSALQRCLDALIGRHEALRTSFEAIDGEVRQVVHPPGPVELPVTDLSALSPGVAAQEALRIATADVRSPLGMELPPLFRIRVVRLAAEEHQIQLTLHHIIFDGVSVYRVLLPELAELYASHTSGENAALPEPALQYGDYAHWRHDQVTDEKMARPLAHWRQALAGEPPVLDLPFDRPRPPEVTYRGASEFFRFPPGLTASLHAMSKAEGVTTYMTLLAAFKTLLFRYGGQEDITVGGITDARRRPELERMMGYFLNPMPLRTRPRGATPFRAYLREVRDTVLGALAASDVPFDHMLRALRVHRDPARHPLFTTMFSIQPPLVLPDAAWDLTQTDVFSGGAKFDIYLELDERPDGYIARAMYNADLFDAATMQRMMTNYITLLQAAVADPGGTLGALPLIGKAERALIEEWNRTEQPAPQTTLHSMVKDQVRRSPQAVAVSCGDRSWTYAELDREVQRLTAVLRGAGAGPGQVVGLYVERSMEMVAALLAVLSSGAAYVPLDATLPLARLKSIVEDADPVLVLTEPALALSLPAGVKRVLLDAAANEAAAATHGQPDSGPDDLAYVIFTSGTTGRPKGVEVSHRAALNTIACVGDVLECSAAEIALAASTLSFDVSVLDLFVPLTRGGHVVVAPRAVARDPVLLAELIDSSGATIMHATPALWRRLVESGWHGGPPGFKAVSAGESLPRSLADALLALGVRLWNAYGPTEAAILASIYQVGRESGSVPIGRPLGNVTMSILDEQSRPAPIGGVGELHIGGAGLARGYRNLDALTEERFITLEGRRLYRTGDLARYRSDGQIAFLGRRDTQVKVRGFRIELEEVEGALAVHPEIAAAAVRAAPDASGETSLTAYLVLRNGHAPLAAELRGFLKATLPGYMIPSGFVSLDALPIGGSGKIDRAALPAAMPPATEAAEELTDEWEHRVARLWSEILGVEAITHDYNFFDLGGHSILVAMLQGRVAKEFGLSVSLADLFRAQTVSRMARLLRSRSEPSAGRTSSLLPIQPAGSAPPLYWIEPYPSTRRVADALGRDQPVLGVCLSEAELDAFGDHPSVESVAARLVRTLTQAAPSGPYHLIGFCNKAVLAFEIASQLRAAGRDVGMLFNINGGNPAFEHPATRISILFSTLHYNVRRTRTIYRRAGLRRALETARAVVARQISGKQALPHTREARIDQMLAHGFRHYKPAPYEGDMTVLQVEELPGVIDFSAEWEGTVRGRLIDRVIPGTHFTVFESDNVPGLAAAIRENLPQPPSRRTWTQ